MTNKKTLYIIITVLLLFFSKTATAESLAVIVHVDNPVSTLSMVEIKKIYENDVLKWADGKGIVLYDLRVKDEARKKFSTAVLDKEPRKVAMEWASRKISNTAKNPPRTVKAAVLVQSKVGKDPTAIGYLMKEQVNSKKVKIVATID